MTLLASTLPSNDGYVAAAYIVFFALILIYVAIMAVRLTRVERRLRELQEHHRLPESRRNEEQERKERENEEQGREGRENEEQGRERELV